MKNLLLILALLCTGLCNANTAATDSVVYHHQATDTTCINSLLQAAHLKGYDKPAKYIEFFARKLQKTPYATGTLEADQELLTINMSEFDCTTFVETVIALTRTALNDTADVDDFVANLRNIRYRGGVVGDYTSRLHYMSDWIADNAERGNFYEATEKFARCDYQTIKLDYISTHSRSYKPIDKDPQLLNKILEVEKKYNNYRYAYIPKKAVASPAVQQWLQSGDIVLFTTSTRGLDVMHMGIITIEHGMPYLIHASSKTRCVVREKQSLYDYMTANSKITGLRVVRL